MKKNFENKNQSTSSILVIFLVSISFAFLVGYGFYGYGIDFYSGYQKGFEWNKVNATGVNFLGYKVSTLIINGFHFGVYVVTFILSLSSGILIKEHLNIKHSYSLIFFLIIFIIALHTWPIIMSTSNAMRQGLAMSFIFLALVSSLRKKYFTMILWAIIGMFMHTSGAPLLLSVIFATMIITLQRNLPYKKKIIINFSIGILIFISAYYSLDFFLGGNYQQSRIIAGDFRVAFVFIGLSYISLTVFHRVLLDNSLNLTLYYFSFIAPALLLNGLNWQYERLGMMMLIPYILSFGSIFNMRSYKFYLFLSFMLLLLLTIYTGMYSEGLT